MEDQPDPADLDNPASAYADDEARARRLASRARIARLRYRQRTGR